MFCLNMQLGQEKLAPRKHALVTANGSVVPGSAREAEDCNPSPPTRHPSVSLLSKGCTHT